MDNSILYKTISYVFLSVLALCVFSCENVASQSDETASGLLAGIDSQNTPPCVSKILVLPMESLSESETAGILFIREEEKLARDVYIRLNELYSLRPFENIQKSEQLHMDAMLFLVNRYRLTDPASSEIGVFQNEELQELHDNLLLRGTAGKTDALMVGALIEETDIQDIRHELDNSVDNSDVRIVYENLLRASGNHLRAFVRVLKATGVEYKPAILDQATFDELVGSTKP